MFMQSQAYSAPPANMSQLFGGDLPVTQTCSPDLFERGHQSDYALASAVAQGRMAALGDLYERHSRRVYAVCLGMTRNPAQAEDLTQEVFVHLLRKIGSFRGDSRFSTWLHRLTVNLVLMHFRRKETRKEERNERLEDTLFILHRSHQNVSTQLTDRMALQIAVRQLPTGCRAVFVLYEIGGYKHDEIAAMLGCTAGTSKSQLHRARKKLRALLRSDRGSVPFA